MADTPSPDGNYQIWPDFVGTDGSCTDSLYLLPPAFSYQGSYAWSTSLLFSPGGDLSKTVGNDDFTLTLKQTGGKDPDQFNVAINLTITGKNMWACAPNARAALMGNFATFVAAVEAELELAGVLVPGATAIVAQQVADLIAAPLLETLFYRYRFSPGTALGTTSYVDVRPGMRLRVDTEVRQFVTPSSPLNASIATGSLSIQVASSPSGATRTTAFDPLLATIRAPKVAGTPPTPVQSGGLLDLSPVAAIRRHWRLLYPDSVVSPTDPGDTTIAKNVTLLGADTLTDLDNATSSWPKSPGGSAVTAIFLGRALALPEIPVWTSNSNRGVTALEYLSIGTTIANLVERFGPIPIDAKLNPITVARPTTATGSGGSFVEFPPSLKALTSTLFDVPLAAGDVLSFSY